MLKLKLTGAIILASLLSAPASATEGTPSEPSAGMPMMQQGSMMTPETMMQMMAPRSLQAMPMMNPQMMQMMPHMGYGPGYGHGQAEGYHHGMPMMGGVMGPMMMYPQMMGGTMGPMAMNPQMMQMRLQHMQKMEQHLQNIEKLLQQLVDQGKSG